jgi:uncharacterized HAD superfamily protein
MTNNSAKILPRELAFDIDGVVADTFRIFVKTAKEIYGIEIEYENITEYEFWEIIDLDREATERIIQMILDQPLEMGIRPIGGAVEVLKRLSKIEPLLFVTARPDEYSILKWVQKELGLEGTDTVCVKAAGNHSEKLPVLLEHGKKYFIEDRLETCYLLDEASVTPIVFAQPWNRKPHPFRTVRNWQEIDAMIDWQ